MVSAMAAKAPTPASRCQQFVDVDGALRRPQRTRPDRVGPPPQHTELACGSASLVAAPRRIIGGTHRSHERVSGRLPIDAGRGEGHRGGEGASVAGVDDAAGVEQSRGVEHHRGAAEHRRRDAGIAGTTDFVDEPRERITCRYRTLHEPDRPVREQRSGTTEHIRKDRVVAVDQRDEVVPAHRERVVDLRGERHADLERITGGHRASLRDLRR